MHTTSNSVIPTSKIKYLVITAFVLLLGFTVYKMIKFEDSIREQRIVKINVGGEKKRLIPLISQAELQKKSENSKCRFKTGKNYFSVLETKIYNGEKTNIWRTHFLKGVNMGVALPGKYPSEFSANYNVYMDWFRKIADMNSNTVRIYTILPPEFYEAFAQYNLDNADKHLYLLQGVWADETDSNDYLQKEYSEKFQSEIKDVINVIHGNSVINERRGHASGIYARDVSDYTIGILLGREWEPVTVTTTNRKNKSMTGYNGNFISLPHGTPMEVWLAQMMDFTVQCETQLYEKQRPVSFVNWLPTDPMYHNSEFIESKKVREYDNDLESIDFNKFYITNLFKAGIFASYHAYPYYPDFVFLDAKYTGSVNKKGNKDNFYGYLNDLKENCIGMPLLITEYGVPSSRGNSHSNPDGLSQGGHSEESQAEINKTLTEDIFDSGCGGAVYFEWMDEWFKFNWLVIDFEVPAERRKLWHNMQNPEQNFGVLAVEQRTKIIDGLENDWGNTNKDKEKSYKHGKFNLSYSSDAEYFYVKYNLPDFDFAVNNIHIAMDTYDKVKGDHKLPFLNESLDRGIEFLINVINTDSAEILVDAPYSLYSDIYNDYIPVYASKENSEGKFVRQILLSNREREGLDGSGTGRTVYDWGSLIYGKSDEFKTSNSNWYWNEKDKILEMRIPWLMLNVSDPSSKRVLDDVKGTGEIESSDTEGFHIYSFITDKQDRNVIKIPDEKSNFFEWEKWEIPEYKTRFKKSYFMFQELFAGFATNEDSVENTVTPEFRLTEWYNNHTGALSVSLDDASMTQITEALPVLDKYGFTATYAMVTDWTQDDPALSSEEGNFSIQKFGWKQAKELIQNGNEIASHNKAHIKLDTIPEDRVLEMMKDSKQTIENKTGYPVYTFVFPYSSTKPYLFPITKKAGYLFARTGTDQINTKEVLDFSKLATIAIVNENDPSPQVFYEKLKEGEGKWLILNYHHFFPNDSKEMGLLKYHNVTNTYSVTSAMFERQMRLVRNTDFWVAPISVIGRFIMQKDNSKPEITDHGDKILLKVNCSLDNTIFNIPMTVEYTTNHKIMKNSNSLSDGIYNSVNNKVYINVLPGEEVIIEILNQE
ncbi:MAG TPA: polysaccharide deacetylase family protein [Ignavibacteria bacterium]|nr:polysaccharide deacetylase family protein [Ignavibacteria bacterium]